MIEIWEDGFDVFDSWQDDVSNDLRSFAICLSLILLSCSESQPVVDIYESLGLIQDVNSMDDFEVVTKKLEEKIPDNVKIRAQQSNPSA